MGFHEGGPGLTRLDFETRQLVRMAVSNRLRELHPYWEETPGPRPGPRDTPLTPRQRGVFDLRAHGLGPAAAARRLGISTAALQSAERQVRAKLRLGPGELTAEPMGASLTDELAHVVRSATREGRRELADPPAEILEMELEDNAGGRAVPAATAADRSRTAGVGAVDDTVT